MFYQYRTRLEIETNFIKNCLWANLFIYFFQALISLMKWCIVGKTVERQVQDQDYSIYLWLPIKPRFSDLPPLWAVYETCSLTVGKWDGWWRTWSRCWTTSEDVKVCEHVADNIFIIQVLEMLFKITLKHTLNIMPST